MPRRTTVPKTTKKNLRSVLNKLADYAEENDDNAKVVVDEVNKMLDELKASDFFGTEGQCDPRGDWRDVG